MINVYKHTKFCCDLNDFSPKYNISPIFGPSTQNLQCQEQVEVNDTRDLVFSLLSLWVCAACLSLFTYFLRKNGAVSFTESYHKTPAFSCGAESKWISASHAAWINSLSKYRRKSFTCESSPTREENYATLDNKIVCISNGATGKIVDWWMTVALEHLLLFKKLFVRPPLLLKLMLNILKWRDKRAHFYLSCCKINALWASRVCSVVYFEHNTTAEAHFLLASVRAIACSFIIYIQPSLLGSRLGTTISIAWLERKSIEANVPQCPSEGASMVRGAGCVRSHWRWVTNDNSRSGSSPRAPNGDISAGTGGSGWDKKSLALII